MPERNGSLNRSQLDIAASFVAVHVGNDDLLAESLERLGMLAKTREQELELSQAFMKFSHVTRELASLMKDLVSSPCVLFMQHNSTWLEVFVFSSCSITGSTALTRGL